MAASDPIAPGFRPQGNPPPPAELLPATVRGAAFEIAGQLVGALDRLAAVTATISPGTAASASLAQAQDSIRSAAEMAGRLAALAEQSACAGARAVPLATDCGPPAHSATVLLVDDDESVRASLLALLRARGARVLAAADGQEAIDLFQERFDEVDVVVLDHNMPAITGTSVLRELRAIRPDIKVVISSGDFVESWDRQVDECNRLAFAHKALGPQELIAQLERLLERTL
jgi:CheY-like chemotaxis protein